jgi:hypothetical protein
VNESTASAASAASADANSPVRTRKNRAASFVQSAFGPSPRRGVKSKQRRVDDGDGDYVECDADDTIIEQWRLFLSDGFGFHGKPSTEFMGWRRLTPAELLHLDVGSFFLLSIPPNSRHEDSDVIKLRKAFTKRVIEAVIRSKRNEFPDNGLSVERRALDYLHLHNGLIRNGFQYIEIPCVVKVYPHRYDYISNNLSQKDVCAHVAKGGGIDIIILDYPNPAQRRNNTVLLKWNEVPTIQIFTQHYRGDSYPKIQLSKRRTEHAYCDELADSLEIVKDDTLATTQLLLAFEKEKNTHLESTDTRLKKESH